MRGSRKFCRRGSNFDVYWVFFRVFFFVVFFLVDAEERKDLDTTVSQQMTFRWRADNGSTLNAGFVVL